MFTLAFAMLLTFVPPPQQADYSLVCSTHTGEPDSGSYNGEGGCDLTYKDMHFESDWIVFDNSSGNVTAGDHVRFTRGTEQIEGSFLRMNAQTKSGTIWNAKGKLEPGFHVTAQVAERFADETWEFHNVTVTACESPKPCWLLSQARVWYRPGDYVKGKNTVFRFHDVPIFWMPVVVAPSESRDRQTGFLIPSISKSTSRGRGIREEFYYVINDSADASFVGEYYSLRGPTGELNFRAKPTSTGWISVNSFFAHDRLKQGGHSLRILSYSNLGQYSRAVVDLEQESSVTFRQVWGDSFNVIASPINRSVGFLSTNKPDYSANILYSRYVFLQTAPSTAIRKFPAAEFSMPSHQFFENIPAYFRFDGSFSGISRRDALINTPSFGERFDFHPSVEVPVLRTNAFELSQQVGVRETGYSHSLRPNVQQNALNRFTVEYAARFSGPELEKSYGKWRHSIQPTVEYRYVTGAERFREAIIVDDVDLVADTSEVEYGITNRVIANREILRWRVAQTAYFNPTFGGAIQDGHRNVFNPLLGLTGFSFADGPRHTSPIVSTLRLEPTTVTSVDFQVDYDTQLSKIRSAGIISTLRKGMWSSNLLYAFTRPTALQAPNNQVHGTLSYGNGVNRGFSFSSNISYDIRKQLFQGASTQLGYNTECYGVSVEFTQYNIGARQEHKLRFAFSLKNIGAFGNMRRQDRVF